MRASARLRAMLSRLLRGLALASYALVIFLVFGLAAYTSFSLFVRSGVTNVPPLRGLTREEAATRLADQGLTLRRDGSEERYDDEIPAGRAVKQSPDARTLVKRGSTVSIVFSKGPRRAEVPELDGKTLPEAQAALSGNGLGLGRILGAFAPGRRLGAVLAQDPDPRAAIPPSMPVDLLLAMPTPEERYVMPDLVYRDYDLVRPFFERHGFRFGNVKFERYEGVASGIILRQFPLPGHPLSKDEAITLVVATADNLPDAPGLDAPGLDAPGLDAPPPVPPPAPTPAPPPPAETNP
ncbi:MAG TPA: PASTA domain-containing protein [Thermoanaerobaculia bacterium]